MKSLTCCLLFCLPLKNLYITSGFGNRIHPITRHFTFHSGIDLRARHDTVFAIIAGRTTTGFDHRLGVFFKIENENLQIIYGHLSQALIAGSVQAGDAIGVTGSTGQVTGEHLHLSIKYKKQYVDPIAFLYELTIKSKSP